jgi:hypothetical protein
MRQRVKGEIPYGWLMEKGGNILKLLKNILSRGCLDVFRNPAAAFRYWRQVAGALSAEGGGGGAGRLLLPALPLEQLVAGADFIPLTFSDYICSYGEMPLHEMVVLCRTVRAGAPERIFEIGTYHGGTTLQLAANSTARIYTLDLPPEGERPVVDPELDTYPPDPGIRFRESPAVERIEQLYGDSADFDFSPYAGRIDVIFVDGNHHYEFVRRDSVHALKMLAPGGKILWHDYAPYAPGVVRALNELGDELELRHIEGTSLVLYDSRAAPSPRLTRSHG